MNFRKNKRNAKHALSVSVISFNQFSSIEIRNYYCQSRFLFIKKKTETKMNSSLLF